MSTNLELIAAREFVAGIEQRMKAARRAATEVPGDFPAALTQHVVLCQEMAAQLLQWAQRVFKGQTAYDSEVESVLKGAAAQLLRQVKSIAAHARAVDHGCYALLEMHELHYHLADLTYLYENWVQPKLSISPAPRVKIPETTLREMQQRLQALRQSPGWIPDETEPTIPAHVPQS
jgi:hypothetical protein